MVTTLISKLGFPVLALVAGIAVGMGINTKLMKPCPQCPQCPSLKCPDVKTQGIDFEKIKGMKGTINLHQHYTVEMNGDSLIIDQLLKEIDSKLKDLNVVRCKK